MNPRSVYRWSDHKMNWVIDFKPCSPAVGVARELLDYLKHGVRGKGLSYVAVMAKVAEYLLRYAEALEEQKND